MVPGFTTWSYVWKDCAWSLARYCCNWVREFFQVNFCNQRVCLESFKCDGMSGFGAGPTVGA